MPRPRKEKREIKSKYSIRLSAPRVAEMTQSHHEKAHALWAACCDAKAKAKELEEKANAMHTAIVDEIEAAGRAIVAKHAHPFLAPGYKWIDDGRVKQIEANNYGGVRVSASLNTRYQNGFYDYEKNLESAYMYLSLLGNTTIYLQKKENIDELLHEFDVQIGNLTAEAIERKLGDMYMVDQSIRVGAEFPKKSTIKGWLRKWGMKATNGTRRNDHNDETGFLTTTPEDQNCDPCRGFYFNGPSSGSKDLREFAKFTQQMNMIKTELEKKKVFDRVEREQHGYRERYTFILKVK